MSSYIEKYYNIISKEVDCFLKNDKIFFNLYNGFYVEFQNYNYETLVLISPKGGIHEFSYYNLYGETNLVYENKIMCFLIKQHLDLLTKYPKFNFESSNINVIVGVYDNFESMVNWYGDGTFVYKIDIRDSINLRHEFSCFEDFEIVYNTCFKSLEYEAFSHYMKAEKIMDKIRKKRDFSRIIDANKILNKINENG